jgi:hypothetical protein
MRNPFSGFHVLHASGRRDYQELRAQPMTFAFFKRWQSLLRTMRNRFSGR